MHSNLNCWPQRFLLTVSLLLVPHLCQGAPPPELLVVTERGAILGVNLSLSTPVIAPVAAVFPHDIQKTMLFDDRFLLLYNESFCSALDVDTLAVQSRLSAPVRDEPPQLIETAQYDHRTKRLVLQGRIQPWNDRMLEYNLGEKTVGLAPPAPQDVSVRQLFDGKRRFRKIGAVIRYDDPDFPTTFEVPSAISDLAPDGFVGWFCSMSSTHASFLGVIGAKPDLREVIHVADLKAGRWLTVPLEKNVTIYVMPEDIKTHRDFVIATEGDYVPSASPDMAGRLVRTNRCWIHKLGAEQAPTRITFATLQHPRVLDVRDDIMLIHDGVSLYRAQVSSTGFKNLQRLLTHESLKTVCGGVWRVSPRTSGTD